MFPGEMTFESALVQGDPDLLGNMLTFAAI